METTIGGRLKQALEMRCITQRELADKTNLTEVSISRYVNNIRRPNSKAIKTLCQVLNVPADWLLGFTDILNEPKNISAEIKTDCNKSESLDDNLLDYHIKNLYTVYNFIRLSFPANYKASVNLTESIMYAISKLEAEKSYNNQEDKDIDKKEIVSLIADIKGQMNDLQKKVNDLEKDMKREDYKYDK